MKFLVSSSLFEIAIDNKSFPYKSTHCREVEMRVYTVHLLLNTGLGWGSCDEWRMEGQKENTFKAPSVWFFDFCFWCQIFVMWQNFRISLKKWSCNKYSRYSYEKLGMPQIFSLFLPKKLVLWRSFLLFLQMIGHILTLPDLTKSAFFKNIYRTIPVPSTALPSSL